MGHNAAVIKVALVIAIISALTPFHSSVKPLPNSAKTELKKGGYWHKGCPVGLSDLRVLTVTYRGFDGHNHSGQLVTNRNAAPKLARVFHELFRIHFPIHHMSIASTYGSGGR